MHPMGFDSPISLSTPFLWGGGGGGGWGVGGGSTFELQLLG